MSINKEMGEEEINSQFGQSRMSLQNGHLQTEEARFVKKVFRVFCKMKNTFIFEFFRLGIYMWLAVAVFGVFYSKSSLQMNNYAYFTGDQVVNTPEIKGLFPPVKGSPDQIVGRWQVSFVNSLQITNNQAFSQYTLQFKEISTEKLRMTRDGCNGDYVMLWDVFSYNMVIKDFEDQVVADDMVISADRADTSCILDGSNILQYLKNVSVWAIEDQCLFLLVEQKVDNNVIESILILEKK